MTPAEQRQAIVEVIVAVADAKATGNPLVLHWTNVGAEKRLHEIIPDAPPKPKLADITA